LPAKRRRTMDRNPIHRFIMWDKKTRPDIVAEHLRNVKSIGATRMLQYQIDHETMIAKVRDILSRYPDEAHLLQEYMWFAEKLYKLRNKYSRKALQLEVDAVYLYYLLKGRRDDALREVAMAMGVHISPLEEILSRIGAPGLIRTLSYRVSNVITICTSPSTCTELYNVDTTLTYNDNGYLVEISVVGRDKNGSTRKFVRELVWDEEKGVLIEAKPWKEVAQ